MDVKRANKSAAVAAAYHQGDVAGLSDAMTRRLVASTVYTESNGGDLSVTNAVGYTGRYQAGALWLADAGYVDAAKAHNAMRGYRNEWQWAESGGMKRFLADSSNWNNGLSLDSYKASPELQDKAFKTVCDAAYKQALKAGTLHANDSERDVAGFLKARHISGLGGATGVVEGRKPVKDGNKTSNYDYFNDVASNRDGLDNAIGAALVPPQPSVLPGIGLRGHRASLPPNGVEKEALRAPVHPGFDGSANAHRERAEHGRRAMHVLREGAHGAEVERLQVSLNRLGAHDARGRRLATDGDFRAHTREAVENFQRTHELAVDGVVGKDTREALGVAERSLVTHPDHLHHPLFKQSLAGVHRAERERGIASGAHSEHVAGAVTVQAVRDGLQRVDRVELNDTGSLVRGVQVGARDEAALNRATQPLDTAQAVQQSVAESSRQVQDAEQRRQAQVEQQHAQLSRPHVAGMQGLAPAM